MSNIIEVRLRDQQQYKLCQLIDLAGFTTIINKQNVTLIDKTNRNADQYSDLCFKTLFEAIQAVAPYLKSKYKFIA
jgi:hypothetical protein